MVVNQASSTLCAYVLLYNCISGNLTFVCTNRCLYVCDFAVFWALQQEVAHSLKIHSHLGKVANMTEKTKETEKDRETGYISSTLTVFRCAVTASFCCLCQPVMCHNCHFIQHSTHKWYFLVDATFRLSTWLPYIYTVWTSLIWPDLSALCSYTAYWNSLQKIWPCT